MKNYWNNNGKFQNLVASLQKLIPVEGQVPYSAINPKLEKFRVASNCYHDLFNNGLGNRATEFRLVFGFPGSRFGREIGPGEQSAEMKSFLRRVEKKMDEIILAASVEQEIS